MAPLYCSKGHENPSGNRFCRLCGEKLTQPEAQGVEAGMVMGGRYRIVRELGHGGFGRTYLAEDLNRFNESCVLKEFAPQVQGTYALQKAEELFEREAGILYQLQHPQIPKFREMFRVKQGNKGRLFLVQDYVVGQTYHALLDARKQQGLRFNEAEVTQLLLQILPVLEYIHSLGVIHRDISPDNLILRSTDGLPVLIDFGGVKQVAASVASQVMGSSPVGSTPAHATRLGKVGFAPHEQMQGGMAYPHSDFYALGATVLVLLTGKEPQLLIDPNTLAWNWRREVNLSPKLGNVLDKMLQLNPTERYQSAREVLQSLAAPPEPPTYLPTQLPSSPTEATMAVSPPLVVANSSSSPIVPVTPSPSSTDQPSSGWWGKILVVLVLIPVAGGIGWLAGNWWIKSQLPSDNTPPQPTETGSVSPTLEPTPEPSSPFTREEIQRKERLQQRRVALDIRYEYYASLVNEEYWSQYPDRRGQTLGEGSEEAEARAQWDAIASNVLRQLDNLKLSASARRQLGNYTEADLTRAKAEANQLRVSSRSLYDLVDAKFFLAFPEQKENQDFRNKPIFQVWQAMVGDTLTALKTKEALEQIEFDPEAVSKTVSGTLKPGGGKVFLANLAAGQTMNAKLQTGKSVLFSIYSPSGKTILLEDSRDRTWSGELPESGLYEFVIVSESSGSMNYQLELSVENSVPTEPTPESPVTPESSPIESPS
ncbi:MAG TPA: serine/threonine-protein kinase [Stenomitos sp.]